MKKFNCPSCGAEVIFQSNVSVYAVCAFCSSMIVRRDIDVEAIGTMASLPDDMSPLQLGTEGSYQGNKFSIIGRMKIGWQDGVWNEWHTLHGNGERGWLAEAQGSYAVCFDYDETLPAETVKTINSYLKSSKPQPPGADLNTSARTIRRQEILGTSLFIDRLKYKVVDVKQAVCLACEGELPFIAPNGRKTLAIDLLGLHGEFASIELAQDNIRVYVGRYLEWNDFNFKNVRPLDDW